MNLTSIGSPAKEVFESALSLESLKLGWVEKFENVFMAEIPFGPKDEFYEYSFLVLESLTHEKPFAGVFVMKTDYESDPGNMPSVIVVYPAETNDPSEMFGLSLDFAKRVAEVLFENGKWELLKPQGWVHEYNVSLFAGDDH